MPVSLAMPQFGQSVTEGTVAAWLKSEGDSVDRDESLLTVSTDKIDTDLPCPAAGVLLRVCVQEGQTVTAGTILAWVGEAGEQIPEVEPPPMESASLSKDVGEPAIATERVGRQQRKKRSREGFLSPVVARLAAEHNVNLDAIRGSGRGGRITRKDIEQYIAERKDELPWPAIQGDLQPLTPMRAAIAEHMIRSVSTSAHVTTIHEIDMGAAVQHRSDHQKEMARRRFPRHAVGLPDEGSNGRPPAGSGTQLHLDCGRSYTVLGSASRHCRRSNRRVGRTRDSQHPKHVP